MSAEALYVVWSIEHTAWWKAGKWGYAETLAEAGRFTHAEALEILERANAVKVNECVVPITALAGTLAFSPSEIMALRSIVAHYLTIPRHSGVFVDVRRHIETTPEQLLVRLIDVQA